MYTKNVNEIKIDNLKDFNINQIFDCGQIFRYYINNELAVVVSKDKLALIKTNKNFVQIFSNDIDYFEQFFDLKTDYSAIKQQLKRDDFLRPCCEFGYGIRILKQDLFEMIVSFIVSANNNIKRIKNSLNYLSKNFGTKIKVADNIISNIDYNDFIKDNPLIQKNDKDCFYYAFPTVEQLKQATVEDYVKAGLGYRSSQMYDTIQKLKLEDLNKFYSLTFDEQIKYLLGFKGVGEKVANCVMLFANVSKRMFPVDTWINKVYNSITNTNNKSRTEINKELIKKYQDLSGYAQQYFFYYYRENKLN